MFFNGELLAVFVKFLYAGLIFGFVKMFCRWVVTLSKKNIIISNIVSFCFWLGFGGVFSWICLKFYNYSFCWFGLLGMTIGLILVKISFDFFFTNLFLLLYNKIRISSVRKKANGKS